MELSGVMRNPAVHDLPGSSSQVQDLVCLKSADDDERKGPAKPEYDDAKGDAG
jgi:hypothetical protein